MNRSLMTKADGTELKVDLMKFMTGMLVAQTGIVIGAVYFLLLHFKS